MPNFKTKTQITRCMHRTLIMVQDNDGSDSYELALKSVNGGLVQFYGGREFLLSESRLVRGRLQTYEEGPSKQPRKVLREYWLA